jgi:hypothetical protein
MLSIRSRQFQHAGHWQILVEPLGNLSIKYRHRTAPITRFRELVDVFWQHTRNRVPVVTGTFRDLHIGPAFLFQVVNR